MIREATAADMAAVTAIHNEQAIASTNSYDWTSFDEQHWPEHGLPTSSPPGVLSGGGAGRRSRRLRQLRTLPRGKAGWQFTVEHSVYLAAHAVGLGLGRALMTELMPGSDSGRACDGGDVDDANQDSQQFHRALGFELMGVIREGGRKFDRWLDCAFWTLQLS